MTKAVNKQQKRMTGCPHSRISTQCEQNWLFTFQPAMRLINKLAEATVPQLPPNVGYPEDFDRKSNGQVKNFFAERAFLQTVQKRLGRAPGAVLYTGAAPGYHLFDLAFCFPLTKFHLHDSMGCGYADRLTQMPNVVIIKDLLQCDVEYECHIDDNLPEGAISPKAKYNLRKWMPLEATPHLRKDAHIIYPACSSTRGNELKQSFDNNPALDLTTKLAPDSFFKLHALRHVHVAGNCQDCHEAERMHTNYMKWAMDTGNKFKPRVCEQMEEAYVEMLKATFRAETMVCEVAGGHLEIKLARDYVRAFLHNELRGLKIVEAGPRTAHFVAGATEQVGWHFCHPKLANHDKDLTRQFHMLNTVCSHPVEECTCADMGSAQAVLGMDVYFTREQVDAIVGTGKSLYWSFNNLPHGRHIDLGINVVRTGGRYHPKYDELSASVNKSKPLTSVSVPTPEGGHRVIVATDSADKQYDDPDPFEVLKGMNYRVVYNNGIYVVVQVYPPSSTGDAAITLGDLGPLMDLSALGTNGVVPSWLCHHIAAHVSPNELDKPHDCIARIQKQFKIRSYDLASKAVFGAQHIIATNLREKATAVVKLVGSVNGSQRVTHGVGAKILSVLGEMGEGTGHPFLTAFKAILRSVLEAGQGMLKGLHDVLAQWVVSLDEKAKGHGFTARIYQFGAIIARAITQFLEYLMDIPAQTVIPPTELEETENNDELPDIVQNFETLPPGPRDVRVSARDITYSAAPPIRGVPRPVLLKTNNQRNGVKVLRHRLGKHVHTKTLPENERIFEKHLDDVFDEVTSGVPVEPIPFRLGFRTTRKRIHHRRLRRYRRRMSTCAGLDSASNTSEEWTAFSRPSLSSQARPATLSGIEMTTIGPSLDDIFQLLSENYDNIRRPNALAPTDQILRRHSYSSQGSTTSSRQTTPPGTSTSPLTFSEQLTRIMQRFSAFHQKTGSTLRPFWNRTCELNGSSVSECATPSVAPESPATLTPLLETQSLTSRLTGLLPNCPDLVRKILDNVLRAMIASSDSEPDVTDDDLTFLITSALGSTSSGDTGELLLTWNSVAVSLAQSLIQPATRWPGIRGKFCDILLSYLASVPGKNTWTNQDRSCFVRPWCAEAFRFALQCLDTGGGVLVVPLWISPTMMSSIIMPPTPAQLQQSQKRLDERLPNYGVFPLTSSVGPNAISMKCSWGRLLTITPCEAYLSLQKEQEAVSRLQNQPGENKVIRSRWLCQR